MGQIHSGFLITLGSTCKPKNDHYRLQQSEIIMVRELAKEIAANILQSADIQGVEWRGFECAGNMAFFEYPSWSANESYNLIGLPENSELGGNVHKINNKLVGLLSYMAALSLIESQLIDKYESYKAVKKREAVDFLIRTVEEKAGRFNSMRVQLTKSIVGNFETLMSDESLTDADSIELEVSCHSLFRLAVMITEQETANELVL